MPRQIVDKLRGLMTTPNKFGVLPPGAMQIARNVCLRQPGVLETAPDVRTLRTNVSTTDSIVRMFDMSQIAERCWGIDDGYALRTFSAAGTSLLQYAHTGSSHNVSFTYAGWIQKTISRNRAILTNSAQPVISDDVTASIRLAGLPPPAAMFVGKDITSPSVWAVDKVGRWCGVFRRKQSDGYEQIGPVSAKTTSTNTALLADPNLFVGWGSGTALLAGDFFDLYRTPFQDSGIDPGDTFYYAGSHVITAGEITTGSFQFVDRCLEAALGAELYTNPGQPSPDGPRGQNFSPPPSNDVCTFAESVLYASTSELHTMKLSVPNTIGQLTTAAQRVNGIGQRTITGTTVVGSPVITAIADTSGVVAGQRVSPARFPVGTKVVSKTATTVTVDQNATGTVGFISTYDVIEIDGVGTYIDYPFALFYETTRSSHVSMYPQQSITSDITGTTIDGIQFEIVGHTPINGSFSVRATNGANYSPPLPEITATAAVSGNSPRTNRIHASKPGQPEAVPPLSYFFVGHGDLLRTIPLRASVLAFCSDGLYRITGDGVSWAVDLIDPELRLLYKNGVGVMNGVCYAITNCGLVAVSESGATMKITDGVIDDIWTSYVSDPYGGNVNSSNGTLTCDEVNREVVCTFRGFNATPYAKTLVYNTKTEALWTLEVGGLSVNNFTATTFLRWPTAGIASLAVAVDNVSASDTYYFYGNDSDQRMDYASALMQPVSGSGLSLSKQWTDVKMLCDKKAFSVRPLFPDASAVVAFAERADRAQYETTLWVPRKNAIDVSLAFGFDMSFALCAVGNSHVKIYALNYGWEEDSEEAGSP